MFRIVQYQGGGGGRELGVFGNRARIPQGFLGREHLGPVWVFNGYGGSLTLRVLSARIRKRAGPALWHDHALDGHTHHCEDSQITVGSWQQGAVLCSARA